MGSGRLAGRVAIVTGAAGGLGVATCAALAGEGALVVPVDVAGEGCLLADVGTAEGNARMVEEALARHGRLDVLVLNAGLQHMAPIPEFPEERWDRLMDVMVKGPFLAMRAAWPHLTARPGGRIVVTASASSYVAERYKAAYVAAKHAVVGLVKVAALEGGPFGLTANAVAPGGMLTGIIRGQLADQSRLHGVPEEEILARFASHHPAGGRFVEPEEVAATIAFLASDEASGLNGTVVPVDLGILAV